MMTERSGLILLCGADRDACLRFTAALEAEGHETKVVPAQVRALHAELGPNGGSPRQICKPDVALLFLTETAPTLAQLVSICEVLSPVPAILVADEDSLPCEDLAALDLYAWLPEGTGVRALVATVEGALTHHRLKEDRDLLQTRHRMLCDAGDGIYEPPHRLQVFHEQLIEQMTEGLEVADAETRITFVNPAGARMLGYAVDELLGMRSTDIIPPDQASIVEAANARRRRGESDRYRLDLLRKDGSRLPTMVSGAPRYDEAGEYAGTLSVFTDISEQVVAEEALRHRVALERMLIGIATAFIDVDPDDLDGLIRSALADIGKLLGMDYGFVFLYDDQSQAVTRTHVWGREGLSVMSIDDLPPPHFSWWLRRMHASEAVVIPSVDDLPDEAAPERGLLAAQGVGAVVAMPLAVANELMGFLGFAAEDEMTPWLQEDLGLLQLLAGIIGSALTRRETLLHVTHQADRLSFVHKLGQALATTVDVGDICRTVYDQLRAVTEVTSFNVTRHDAGSGLFHPLYEVSHGRVLDPAEIESVRLDPQNTVIGRAVRERETTIVDDFQDYRHHLEVDGEHENAQGIRAVLTAPMIVERDVIGTLQIQSAQAGVYTEEDARLLSAVATQVGLAVQNARLLERARDQALRLQEVMRSVPDGVLLIDDATGEVLLANPAGEIATGLLAGAGIGERIVELAERPWRSWLRPAPQGLWHEITLEGPPRRIFELTARPVRRTDRIEPRWDAAADEAPIAWVIVVRDVTEERVRAERAQQQDRLVAVGQLAAGIAHDFSNIMAVIVLYAQMSQAAIDIPDPVRGRLQTIVDQARSASDLIQQILDFSRSSTLERRRLDLTRFLKEQVKLLQRMVPEHIDVEMVYGPGEHVVNVDPTSIQQVVMNLAVNARDAMPQGGQFTLALDRIEVKPDEPPPLPGVAAGVWIRLTATDTGVGIEREVLPHIFDPFFTTKGPDGGTGLGLAQVHGIVKQHDGEIEVASTLGHGTIFRIYLPALPPTTMAQADEEVDADMPQGRGETVLVVEDATAARASLVESLRVLNYAPVEASNGLQALAAFEDAGGEVDLVLSDLVMPDMGGIELVNALRDRGVTIPVILLSGHILDGEPLDLVGDGVVDLMRKPIHLPVLANVVARALRVT